MSEPCLPAGAGACIPLAGARRAVLDHLQAPFQALRWTIPSSAPLNPMQAIALPSSKAAPALPTVLTYAASMVSQSFEDKRNHFMAELRTYDRQPGRQHRYIPSVIKLVYHSLPEPGVSGCSVASQSDVCTARLLSPLL